MKLIGVMLARNEDWILKASLPVALRWCDEVVLVDHASTDKTYAIYNEMAGRHPRRIWYSRWDDDSKWDEMEMRQHSLAVARKHKATHVAIIDSDEILTANLTDWIRPQIDSLPPGMSLDVPMLAMRSLENFQDDDSVWSKAWITLAFRDDPSLSWKPAKDGYEHHHRAPYGIEASRRYLSGKHEGGVMHLQFCNRRRLVAKHWLYAYTDWLRWPERETKDQLSWKYSQALHQPEGLSPVPESWWYGVRKADILLGRYCHQETEILRLLAEHGEEKFDGITLSERRPV